MFRFFLFLLLFSLPTEAAEARTFRYRLVEDMGTLDWNYGEVNPEVVNQIMEGLFVNNRDGMPVPALAQKFHWNSDKTHITLFLRHGVRWSDGKEVCAQDFVDSWNRLQSKEFASPYRHYAYVLKKAEAKSCYQLEVDLTRSAPEFPAILAHYTFLPIRLDALAKNEKIFIHGTDLPVNGPYKISEWTRDQKLVLVPNPRYKGSRGSVDRGEVYFLPEEHTALSLYEQKKLDWFKDISALSRKEEWERNGQFKIFPAAIVYYLGLNAEKSQLLQDKNLREALSAALHRNELTKVIGKEIRGQNTWLPEELRKHSSVHMPHPNLALAKALLQKAEQEKRMDILFRVYNKPAHKLLAEWVQGQWLKAFDVKIPVEVQEAKVYWKEILSNPAPIFLSGLTAPFFHPRAFLQEFLSTSTANWTGWKNAEYDAFVAADQTKKAEELLLRDSFIVPVYSRGSAALVQKGWRGFWINPLGQVFLKDLK